MRRWLEREVENWRVRARPDFVPPEKLAQLEAVVAREHEHVCVACGDPFTSASPDARYCPGGACKQRAYRRRLREAMAA